MKNNKKYNRRDFIKLSSLASVSLPIALSGFPLYANKKPEGFNYNVDNDNILVLIRLEGGNDGLNTIFDLNQYANLQAVRSNIIIPESNLLPLTDSISLHPNLGGLKDVWGKEKLSIIQNVAYPNQNRSHFRSTDIWNSASNANQVITSGWLGRFFDANHGTFPENYPNETFTDPFSLTIGRVVSTSCQGANANFSMAVSDPSNPGTTSVPTSGEPMNNCFGDKVDFINNTISQTNGYAGVIKNAFDKGNNLSIKYPEEKDAYLSKKLKHVARLISGGLKTKVYVVNHVGYDTHNNQTKEGAPTTGNHADLLKELSDAICAFQEDLELLGVDNKVVGMTYSEFGRRIRSNGGLGTDHGTAAPMFLFGTCAKNQMLGDSPVIDTKVEDKEGVPMQYDFRSVYNTVLTEWLGATQIESSSVLMGDFETLPIFKDGCSASLSVDNEVYSNPDIRLYPNPTTDFINISFYAYSSRQPIVITVFDMIGAVVKQTKYDEFSIGEQIIQLDLKDISGGNYFVHFQTKGISKTKKIIKY